MTWELREKIAAVRRAGKRVTVIADRLDTRSYYLATAADRIVLDPQGSLLMPGAQVSRTYLHDLLGKVGLGFEEWRLYKYKSAAETLSRDRMSEADREQWTALVRAAYDEVKRGVVESGRATPEQFDRVVNEEPYLPPNRLLELHWVDELGRAEDVEKAAKGRDSKPTSVASLRARRHMPDETWGPVPTIALVYLVGDCAMDEGIRARASSRAMREYRERSSVKAMVLRVDSPGGDPLASDVVAGETRRARMVQKPVLVSQGRVAASGGYWISMDAEQVSATPFTLTGSIGVIGGWVWNDGLGKKLGLTSDHVQIGKSADLLGGLRIPLFGVTLPERNLDEGERRLTDAAIAGMYDDFTKGVAAGRSLDLAEVRRIAEGRVYDGRAAANLKLVDRIATLDQTIDDAKRRAGIAPGARTRVVEYPRRPFFRLPAFLSRPSISSRGSLAAAVAGRGPEEGTSLTYEARAIQWILDRPGQPLLITPGSLLPPDESAFP
jgi:protease-4